MNGIDDLLLGGGAAGKGMKFNQIGDNYGGTVVSVEVRAYTDLKTGKPEHWEDGNPKQQLAIGIQTDERNPELENDDGVRFDYVKMWGEQKKALRAAAQAAGGSPAVGDFYGVKFVGTKPSSTRGFNDTKLYEYTIRKANVADAALGVPAPAAQAPQAIPSTTQAIPSTTQAIPSTTQAIPSTTQYNAGAAPQAPVGLGAAPEALSPVVEDQIKTLISKSLDDTQIAGIIQGTTVEQIAQIRNTVQLQAAALAGNGF